MMQQIPKISKYILLGLVPLILLMFMNVSVNKHTHILANSEIIVHAHPFQTDTPNLNYNHSKKEYFFYGMIVNSLFLTLIVLAILIILFNQFNKKQFFFYELHNNLGFLQTERNKAHSLRINSYLVNNLYNSYIHK